MNDSFFGGGSGLTVNACHIVEMGACLGSTLLGIRVELRVIPLSFMKATLLFYCYTIISFNTLVVDPSTMRVLYHTIGVVGQQDI